jgi:hypothetical protein
MPAYNLENISMAVVLGLRLGFVFGLFGSLFVARHSRL